MQCSHCRPDPSLKPSVNDRVMPPFSQSCWTIPFKILKDLKGGGTIPDPISKMIKSQTTGSPGIIRHTTHRLPLRRNIPLLYPGILTSLLLYVVNLFFNLSHNEMVRTLLQFQFLITQEKTVSCCFRSFVVFLSLIPFLCCLTL